ncbi:MAG: TIGR03618 family F420-dependent PPOX class oxidoreductase, partial [Chloroflexi bacterium]|nr:TIGR03618 family F420-dependent PPOX class oxidoreductase [Chloroflexota bacterium]
TTPCGSYTGFLGQAPLGTLNTAEVDEFLSQPRTAQLVTMYPTGTPHVAPVWFLWDNGRALVMAGRSTVKIRNIRGNPSVSLCVPTADRPYSFVTVEGTASITDRGLEDMVRRTCVLYDGDERGAEFAAELLAEDRLILIVISPVRFISWKEDEENG